VRSTREAIHHCPILVTRVLFVPLANPVFVFTRSVFVCLHAFSSVLRPVSRISPESTSCVFNLSWQSQPRANGRFIARSAVSSTIRTSSSFSDSSRTPSTPSSLERSISPDRLGLYYNLDSPPTSPVAPASQLPAPVPQPTIPISRRIPMLNSTTEVLQRWPRR